MKKYIRSLFLLVALFSAAHLNAFQQGGGGGGDCSTLTKCGPETCNCTSVEQDLTHCHSASFPEPTSATGSVKTGKSTDDCDTVTIAAGKCVHWEYVWTGVENGQGKCIYLFTSANLRETNCS